MHQSLDDRSPVYNVPILIQLSGSLNEAALEMAIRKVLDRHQTLRSRLSWRGEQPELTFESSKGFKLAHETCSGVPAAMEYIQKRIAEPISLGGGLPVRSCLVYFAPKEAFWLTTVHHLYIDDWSLDIFFEEVRTIYQATLAGQEPDLEALPIQYGDYAAWSKEQRKKSAYKENLTWWKRYLEGLPEERLVLFNGRGFEHIRFSGETRTGVRPALDSARFNEWTASQGGTAFQLLLTAFCVLVYRYSGRNDFVIGLPVSVRDRPETQKLIGLFVNTLPVRFRLEGGMLFEQALGLVREHCLEAFERLDVSYGEMVRDRGAQKSREPIQILFVFQRDREENTSFAVDSSARWIETSNRTAKFDLTIFVRHGSSGVHVQIEFREGVYTRDEVDQLIADYGRLMRAVVDNPEEALDDLKFFSRPPEGVREIDVRDNGGTSGENLLDILLPKFAEHPERIAVRGLEEAYSYRELDRLSRQVADTLLRRGLRPGMPVGVYMPRQASLVIAVLGILRAGMGCLPIDPTYPEARIRQMLDNGKPEMVLTTRSLKRPESQPAESWLDLETVSDASGSPPAPVPPTCIRSDSLAYILYTSGSTGEPKGISMQHGPLVNLVRWQVEQSGTFPVTTQFASIGFDVSFQEILSTLAAGGTLHMVDDISRYDVKKFWQLVLEAGATRLFLPVVFLRDLSHYFESAGEVSSTLREVIVAGETLVIDPTIRNFFRRHPGVTLANQYGPTETHVVTQELLAGDPATWPDFPSIGRPLPGVEIHILGRHGRVLPNGVIGRLHISGDCISQGYWRNPELTLANFRMIQPDNERIVHAYETGDLACYRTDGRLDFHGRDDNQVKIRGFRIEIEDIERNLIEIEGVRRGAVLVREDRVIGTHLVGVVQPELASLDGETLRKCLGKRLPDYMVPGQWIFKDSLPVNANGKIDREAIVITDEERTPLSGEKPEHLLEFLLLGILADLFERADIGVNDDFFAIGGYSLLAVRYLSAIETKLGRKVELSDLFHYPTVRQLANRLQSETKEREYRSLVPIEPEGSKLPIYFVHGWGGEIFVFVELAKLLGKDQPVYGLQAIEFSGEKVTFGTIEEAARHYRNEVKKFQPEGPYRLAGYSLGGMIAYEIARQLVEGGDRVEFLGMIDTFPKNMPKIIYFPAVLPYLISRLEHHWWEAFRQVRQGGRDTPQYIRNRIQALKNILGIGPPRLPGEEISGEEGGKTEAKLDPYLKLYDCYVPKPCPLRIVLFKAGDSKVRLRSIWRHLALEGVEMHVIPGGHYDFWAEKNLKDFASIFRESLEKSGR